MKQLAFLASMLLALLWPGLALAQGDAPLVVPADRHEPGSVATVSRDIRIEGTVDGDVTSWSGSITVVGTVGGDVVSYGGAVTIAPGGQVRGHALAAGNALHVAPTARVGGQRIQSTAGAGTLASVLDLLAPGGGTGAPNGAGRVLFGGTAGALLAAFCLLFAAFWPRRTSVAASTLIAVPGRSVGLGALTTLLLALALPPLLALLVASVVGLPVLVLLLALVLAAYAYGLAVTARLASMRLAGNASRGIPAMLTTLGLVLPIALLGALAPIGGAVLFAVLALPGLGAAILSRGGMLAPLPAR